jgi:2-polyprenyl-3-methyl-5-hydroxy-6-metoxy-1,4-benzoquinol methylase
MSDIENLSELRKLTKETQEIWDENAQWWDETRGEGNHFHQVFVRPATERLLGDCTGKTILDLGCGNGSFSRKLVQLGAKVIACDFSEKLIERATAKTTESTDLIQYQFIDATDYDQLMTLGKRRFDAVVANMVVMDMTTIKPLAKALKQILQIGGCFIFSIPHPCFNNNACQMVIEQENNNGELVTTHAVKVTKYLQVPPGKGLATIDQPTPHYYFHRTLTTLFNTFFDEGFVLNGIEEPTHNINSEKGLLFSTVNYEEIPPIIVIKMTLKI